MKTSSAKAKGRKLQMWVADKIGWMLNKKVGPDNEIASREMGQKGTDIRLVGEAKDLFPFAVECKNCEKWTLMQWIEQAKENSAEDFDWMVIANKNYSNPVLFMDAKTFFEYWRDYVEYCRESAMTPTKQHIGEDNEDH